MENWANAVAVVTGGASGLGAASAKGLTEAGLKVAIFDLNEEQGQAKAAELGGISGEPRIVEYEHLPGLSQLLLGVSSLASQSEADRIVGLMGEFMTPSLEYRYVGPQ